MKLLLAVTKKITKFNIISSKSVQIVSLTWQENIKTIPLMFVVGIVLSAPLAATEQKNSPLKALTRSTPQELSNKIANKPVIEVIKKEHPCERPQPQVIFKPQTIFDVNEDGITFVHRWANAIHIDTKMITLENESSFFLNKCQKNAADMAELERHLRSRKYLRAANVSSDVAFERITVTTWDNWSLMPTVSFGRKGGINTYSFGIKERNLLGLGIDTEIQSYRNTQRSGYTLKATIPLFQKKNTELKLKFADNDDGQQHSLFLHKIFAGFNTKTAYNIGFNEEESHDTIFQNGFDHSIYAHQISYKEANYAWLNFNDDTRLLRYRFGVTQDVNTFSSLPANELANLNSPPLTNELPNDRDLLYPWLAFEFIAKDFRKLTNIHLISQIEDFNHGWQISSLLGIGNGNKENAAWGIFKMQVKKGIDLYNNALLLVDLALENDIYQERSSRLLVKLSGEYFYQLNKTWGFYLSNVNVASKHQYLDKPITMGGNTGLRGFPLQYQHGQNSTKFTSEIRFYPEINLFKLFDLAGVAFVDAGRTYGDSTVQNIEQGWIGSTGFGLRLHSPHSGGNHPIIHIDFAFPQSGNPDINSFEMRVQAKKSF